MKIGKYKKRIAKFLLTGGFAAATEYVTFIVVFQSIRLSTVAANIVSFLMGFMASFLLNKHWVFNNKSDTVRQLFQYCALATVNLSLSTGFIWVLVENMNINALMAKLIVMGLIAVWNFIIFSKIIFRQNEKNTDDAI